MQTLTYLHPAPCPLCGGTLIEYLYKQEPDGYTVGVRQCPNLKPATDGAAAAPADLAADCPRRHMLAGMDNKVLAEGGALCLLKAGHKGDCQIEVEQSTVVTRLAVSQDQEKPPRLVSERKR